ncbi:hypothetical protein [Arthrobacter sp. KK5.5]|uniref:hypothetical protein n=1 Tax=Arthrobacter sp. KK5.5 TaxID=3373084 RepID=UPI003EE76789
MSTRRSGLRARRDADGVLARGRVRRRSRGDEREVPAGTWPAGTSRVAAPPRRLLVSAVPAVLVALLLVAVLTAEVLLLQRVNSVVDLVAVLVLEVCRVFAESTDFVEFAVNSRRVT